MLNDYFNESPVILKPKANLDEKIHFTKKSVIWVTGYWAIFLEAIFDKIEIVLIIF